MGQTVEWLNGAGGKNNDDSRAIATDDTGNSYIGGRFQDTAYFDSITLYSSGSNFYLAKYDSTGGIVWVDTSVFETSSTPLRDIALDEKNHVYVVATGDSIYLNNGKQALNSVYSLVQYGTNGNPNWKVDLPNSFRFNSLSTGLNGNVYLGGYINGQVILGNDTFYNKVNTGDAFLVKYDSSGNYIWGSQGTNGSIYDLSVDNKSNIFSGGQFVDSVIFGSDSIYLNGISAFIVKHDSTGQVKWLKGVETYGAGGICNQVKVNQESKIFAAGNFRDSLKIGSITLNGNSISNGFVTQLNQNGQFQWGQSFGVATNSKFGTIDLSGISSSNNYIYLTGELQATQSNTPFAFGNDTLTIDGSNTSFSPFVTKLDQNGLFLWSFNSSQPYFGQPKGISTDKRGDVYFTGFFGDTLTYQDKTVISNGNWDAFLSKVSDIRILQDTIPDTPLCAGQSLQVPFTVEGDYDPGNTF
ncbi:MAG: hypothetical protein BRD49_00745, partial [Bacteroidetes bacterium SW_10_40_5]